MCLCRQLTPMQTHRQCITSEGKSHMQNTAAERLRTLTCVVGEGGCTGTVTDLPYMSMSRIGILLPRKRPLPACTSGFQGLKTEQHTLPALRKVHLSIMPSRGRLSSKHCPCTCNPATGSEDEAYQVAEPAQGHEPHGVRTALAAGRATRVSGELLLHPAQPANSHMKALLHYVSSPAFQRNTRSASGKALIPLLCP